MEDITKEAIKKTENPIKVTFRDLEYEITLRLGRNEAKTKGQSTIQQKIVKGVSGFALPG